MAEFLANLLPDPRRALDWLPDGIVWRELWFTHHTIVGPVPDEPIFADLEAAVACGWAEGGDFTFGHNDDNQTEGSRTMRAYCTTPAGLRMKGELMRSL